MRTTIMTVVAVTAVSLLVGCTPPPQQAYPQPQATIPGAGMAAGPGGGGPRAVPIRAQLINQQNECIKLLKKNQELSQANRQLTAENKKLTANLAQTTGELTDANATLADLTKELAKWKKDVLGFREEMRVAQRAQLGLMKKLIVLFGGEIPKINPLISKKTAPKKLAGKTEGSSGE